MRLYLGSYGHHPSGKTYSYWGSDNYRTGQNVVAPVTHWKTGRTYNTMFTIMRTSGADGKVAENEAQRLSQSGIRLKFIQGTDVFAKDENGDPLLRNSTKYGSKAEWARDSNARYDAELSARLLGGRTQTDNTQAKQRLLEG